MLSVNDNLFDIVLTRNNMPRMAACAAPPLTLNTGTLIFEKTESSFRRSKVDHNPCFLSVQTGKIFYMCIKQHR